MRLGGILLLLCFVLPASAADLEVRPLFKDNTLRTYIPLPFQVKGASADFTALTAVTVTGSSSCRTLLDPHIPTNFFVKCKEPAEITLSLSYLAKDQIRKVTYGPLQITKISESGEVVDPGGDTGPSAEWLLGQNLYHNKKYSNGKTCASCHDNPAEKADRISVNALNGAIFSINDMKGISLTEAEKKAIVTYVQSFK